ncbi:MAG: Uma2 family endonuclease [Leptolyngbya sp. UWPOB_LEPTO1]|uniref:Uma2 family endonuclease n=1 Tax=Leptolyngbya sp. UWPOB_LEPTO1 TaxID=2815653 RepID=UPI001AD59115|nr:Uma2 family endonuclease [Leptolyngbya sp. UWPOB_LEPTO1]MBN8562447.1 Uma2 family endonuclease [Leptolyngbya sp. UWPOB_LEPTO1]
MCDRTERFSDRAFSQILQLGKPIDKIHLHFSDRTPNNFSAIVQEYRRILDRLMVHPAFIEITDEELMQMSSKNPELRFERNADGSVVTMPPMGGLSGNREAKAGAYLLVYVERNDLGEVFGPTTGFRLSNTAVRSPDAAFVAKDRLPQNWRQQEDQFIAVAPDFVIEIRSISDSLTELKAKMQEYIENGVRLGWLIDCKNKTAFVYRADGSVTQYPESATLSGEDVVPGFTLAFQVFL